MSEHRGKNDGVFPGKAQVQDRVVFTQRELWAAGDLKVRDLLASLETSRPRDLGLFR